MEWLKKHKKVLLIIGVLLIVGGIVALVWWRWKVSSTTNVNKNTLDKPENQNPGSYDKEDFFKAVLAGIGAPVSSTNLAILLNWQRHEGGHAAFNPLNTTKKMNAGETNYNSVGVKNYVSFAQGVDATIRTLKLNYYTAIVDAFKMQLPSWAGNQAIKAALNTWGTVNLAASL